METKQPSNRIHPLLASAAVAVTLVSLVGVAAMTGLFPNSQGTIAQTNNAAMSAAAPMVDSNGKPIYPADGSRQNQNSGSNQGSYQNPSQNYNQNSNVARQSESSERSSNVAAVCGHCGRVESIIAIQQQAKPSGLGVAAGAILGGVLGHQVGNGNGRTLATVAGAVGGGYAGNEVEKRNNTNTVYEVKVRMDDGSVRTFPQNGWRVGDRVKAVNGSLQSMG